ncbi:hypothetical protein KAR91_11260, partial [Candidatus Pacearchaeota archaeon]|nr:hypothetical protein [Candidatus Pacearchaeota archaeon]
MSASRKPRTEIPLDNFIDYILNEHGTTIMYFPDIIAKLFCNYFHIAANRNAINANNLCNTFGFLPPIECPTPHGLDGAYIKTANGYSIFCNNNTSEDSVDYIYLHEIYEIICNRVQL